MILNLIISFLLLAVQGVFSQAPVNIAVLDLEADGISASEAKTLTNKLRGELFKTGKFTVVERGRMDEILKEQGFQQAGCTSQECAVEVGQLLGVDRMIAGSIGKVGSIFLVSLRLLDVGQGKIIQNVDEEISGTIEDVLISGIGRVAKKMAGMEVEEAAKVAAPAMQRAPEVSVVQQTVPGSLLGEYNKQKKNPGAAVVLSTIFPGGGHYYNGSYNIPFGVLYGVSSVFSMLMALRVFDESYPYCGHFEGVAGGNITDYDGCLDGVVEGGNLDDVKNVLDWDSVTIADAYHDGGNEVWLGVSLGLHAINIIHAGLAANSHNQKLKQKYNISLVPYTRERKTGVEVTYDF
jgi:hypothetical protein